VALQDLMTLLRFDDWHRPTWDEVSEAFLGGPTS
jgi:hypothetical protein